MAQEKPGSISGAVPAEFCFKPKTKRPPSWVDPLGDGLSNRVDKASRQRRTGNRKLIYGVDLPSLPRSLYEGVTRNSRWNVPDTGGGVAAAHHNKTDLPELCCGNAPGSKDCTGAAFKTLHYACKCNAVLSVALSERGWASFASTRITGLFASTQTRRVLVPS